MLTSFSLTQLILISVAYLSTLFGIAWITERGYVPRRLVRHPLVYTLSLGVYASAWAFYGTVGLAYQYGYGFLAIYLGISGAFLLAPVLLYPILRVTRAYQLSSLADLFAFRFRSTWAGSRVRMLIESVTAWICRASIGSTPISMNSVVRAPAQVLR
ncbi:ATPase, partial [Pseudomonas aeruginosa]|nr:ATPase [Pseudomonas aeruginosa]